MLTVTLRELKMDKPKMNDVLLSDNEDDLDMFNCQFTKFMKKDETKFQCYGTHKTIIVYLNKENTS